MSYEEYLNDLIKYYKTLKLSKGFSDCHLLLDKMINIFVRMLNKNNDIQVIHMYSFYHLPEEY